MPLFLKPCKVPQPHSLRSAHSLKNPIAYTQTSHHLNCLNGNITSAVQCQNVSDFLRAQKDYNIKICVIGQHGIGKSMLIQKYFKGKMEQ